MAFFGLNAPRERDFTVRVISIGISLSAFLLVLRANVMTFPWVPSIVSRVPRHLLAAYYDFAYVGLITIVFVYLLTAARRAPALQRILYAGFVGLSLLSLAFGLVNVKFIPWLGQPLNYRWLYYSDFLDSQDVRNAIVKELSGRLVAFAAACALGLLVLAWIIRLGLRAIVKRYGWRRPAYAAIAALLICFPLGGAIVGRRPWGTASRPWDRSKLENPVIAFVNSVFTSRRPPSLLTMKTSVGFGDFEPSPPALSEVGVRAGSGPIRNVVVFVMESVGANYLSVYGSPHRVTPQLESHLDRSVTFTDIYAHGAYTSLSLVSMTLSIYPPVSYRSLTTEHPALRFPSLTSELKERGYRAAFFSSSDLRYQKSDVFLAHRGLDQVVDYRSLACPGPILKPSENDPLLDAADDECIVDAFIAWLGKTQPQPFSGVLWTMMTHYPYFPASAETDYGVSDPDLNRYLNALHHTDQVLGKLLSALRSLDLDESTLVVVVGDHGETFGQHGQRIHGDVYEPSLHVPLILINPRLFHGERVSVLGGLIDLAPTILDILGIAPSPLWQGRSLFRSDRTGRVYFFFPFGDHLFGFREGDRKVIDHATEDRFEIYDLANDPAETKNLAPGMPNEVSIARERIAAWLQYQDRMMSRLIAERTR